METEAIQKQEDVRTLRQSVEAARQVSQKAWERLVERGVPTGGNGATALLRSFKFAACDSDMLQKCSLSLSALLDPLKDVVVVRTMQDASR